MLRDRLKVLFKNYDPAVRQIIYEVGELEQQKISMKNPRGILEEIDDIISRVAKEELARQTKNSE